MTLQEHTKHCLELIKQGYGELPVIYAKDPEGNGYHEVHNEPSEFKVDSFSDYYLEPAFEYDDDDEVLPFEPNCIIIN
jgi:hypothetical protein